MQHNKIQNSKLYKFFKRQKIDYVAKKDESKREWILCKKIEDKGDNIQVLVYDRNKKGRATGEVKFRTLIKNRIIKNGN